MVQFDLGLRVKLKKLYSRLAFCYFILLVLLLLGCSSAPTIITVIETDTIAVHDTVHLSEIDSIWYGGIYSDKDSIGSIAISPKSKTAIVDIKWLRQDTVRITVESTKYLMLTGFLERMITTFFTAMPFYWQILLIILLMAILFIIYKLWRIK